MKVVIIGGVAGGASAAARLRRLDESAEIVMFISYYLLTEILVQGACPFKTSLIVNLGFAI